MKWISTKNFYYKGGKNADFKSDCKEQKKEQL